MDEQTIKIIETIGMQWKFLITIFIIIIFIIKWKTIWSFVQNFTQIRIKRGDNEIEFHRKELIKDDAEDNVKMSQEKDKPDGDVSGEDELEINKEPDSPEFLYHKALSDKNFEESNTIFQVLLNKEKDAKKVYELKTRNFYWRHIYGDLTAFEELEKYTSSIEGDNEQKSYALYYLGLIFNESNNDEKAINLIEEAFELTNIDEQKENCISKLSEIHFENDNKHKSIEIILDNIDKIKGRIPKSNLYRSIANYYKKTENKLLESIAYQKALELSPNSTSLLFDSAYKYCETKEELKDIGLLLYKKVLNISPNHQSALNNIGVTYKNLDLDIKSVSEYKKGIEKDSTLAASNIAYLLINNGFKDEAIEYLNKARESKDVHDNVHNATTFLHDKIREEKESEEKILKMASKKYKFLAHFGNSAFTSSVFKFENSNDWYLKETNVDFSIENNNMKLMWENGEEKHNITGGLINNAINATYNKPKRNIYSLSTENKYTSKDFKGYGFFVSDKEINFLFEVEKEIIEFKFYKK